MAESIDAKLRAAREVAKELEDEKKWEESRGMVEDLMRQAIKNIDSGTLLKNTLQRLIEEGGQSAKRFISHLAGNAMHNDVDILNALKRLKKKEYEYKNLFGVDDSETAAGQEAFTVLGDAVDSYIDSIKNSERIVINTERNALSDD